MKKNPNLPLLIAEVANCHGGNKTYLSELVRRLLVTSVDAIKFQFIIASELLASSHPQYALFKSLEFNYSYWSQVCAKVKRSGKILIFDIFGDDSLRLASRLGAGMFKIHTSDFDNLEFIRRVVAKKKPVFLSTGGAIIREVDAVMDICKDSSVCLMVGFQAFPTPVGESNLNRIEMLRQRYRCPVGYMDHSPGQDLLSRIIPCIAVAKGADTVEKHVYLKNRQKSYDWQSALDVGQLDDLRKLLQDSVASCGKKDLIPTLLEKKYIESKRKCAVATRELLPGEIFSRADAKFLWADQVKYEQMISRAGIDRLIGKLIKHKLAFNSAITRKIFK